MKLSSHRRIKSFTNCIKTMAHNLTTNPMPGNSFGSQTRRQYEEITQQQQQPANNFLNDQITNLSITVNSNEVKSVIPNQHQTLVNRTTSAPSALSTNKSNASRQSSECSKYVNTANEAGNKNALALGDYVLFEPQSANDLFGTALNSKTNQLFYWKKFDRGDYLKKLEPYFLMESSERIFGFKEILFDASNFGNEQFAYVIFNQFYGDLHSYMKEKKRLDETEAKNLFRQCVEAVDDCHQNGIIVRDIKLKKFVFTNPEKTKIALTNPEDCLILDDEADNDLIKSQQGCPAYVSPEVLNTNQTKYSGKLSDSWSLGIVLFTLLLGRYPFHHQTITTMFAKIARAKFQIPPSTGLSLNAKILLRSLIRLNPSERLLPSEILNQNWLKQNETDVTQLQQNKFKSLNSAYQYLNHLGSTTHVPLSNNQFYHKPLGISRSSPGSSSIPNSISLPNPIQQTNNFLFARSNAKVLSSTNNDNDDRLVPEFDATTAPINETKRTKTFIDYSNNNNFLV